MRKTFIILSAVLCIQFIYGFQSKYLEIPPASSEARLFKAPGDFPIKTAALIAAGVSEEHMGSYLTLISGFEEGLKPLINTNNPGDAAKTVLQEMHKQLLKRYEPSAVTIDMLIKGGSYSQLTSAAFFMAVLEDFGIRSSAFISADAVLTMVPANGKSVFVSAVLPFGFDMEASPDSQSDFLKLTGKPFPLDLKKLETLDKPGFIAYLYTMDSASALKMKQPASAFLSAAKALVLSPGLKSVQQNAVTAYQLYANDLADSAKDYNKALGVLSEAAANLPLREISISNYYSVLDRSLNQLIEAGQYPEAKAAYDDAQKQVGPNKEILENLYTRILFRLVVKNQDYSGAYETAKAAITDLPDSKNIRSLLIGGLGAQAKSIGLKWQTWPAGEDLFLKWYRLMKDVNFDIALENLYVEISVKNYKAGDTDRGIQIVNKGLAELPGSAVLKKNIVYIAGDAAENFFKKQDFQKGIPYAKLVLDADPANTNMNENLKLAYRVMAYHEIEKEDYKKALSIVAEGLKLYPDDKKLLYYKDYCGRKIKGK